MLPKTSSLDKVFKTGLTKWLEAETTMKWDTPANYVSEPKGFVNIYDVKHNGNKSAVRTSSFQHPYIYSILLTVSLTGQNLAQLDDFCLDYGTYIRSLIEDKLNRGISSDTWIDHPEWKSKTVFGGMQFVHSKKIIKAYGNGEQTVPTDQQYFAVVEILCTWQAG